MSLAWKRHERPGYWQCERGDGWVGQAEPVRQVLAVSGSIDREPRCADSVAASVKIEAVDKMMARLGCGDCGPAAVCRPRGRVCPTASVDSGSVDLQVREVQNQDDRPPLSDRAVFACLLAMRALGVIERSIDFCDGICYNGNVLQ